MSARRIFWGKTLAQAVAKAARQYQVAPELLAWKVYEKRHGFVRHVRAALVEVDPAAPLRSAPEPRAAAAAPSSTAAVPTKAPLAPPIPSTPAPAAAPQRAAPARAPKIVAPRNDEPFDVPDDASEQAALEAIGRMLRFAGIEAKAAIVRNADRIEVVLEAGQGAPVPELGNELLDELEHLLPKAILTISGRRVRATVDFAGQREARAEELRSAATELAARVRTTGASETFGPLTPAERRVVHQLFESDPEIATESLGDGHRKQIRLLRRS